MQTQTPSQPLGQRNQAGAGELPYFQLPEVGHPLSSLAAFFNAQAELKALDALISRIYSSSKKVARAEAMALAGASGYLRMDVRGKARDVVRDGLLPFAWVGTTALVGFEEVAA